jgi:hypothetical protein
MMAPFITGASATMTASGGTSYSWNTGDAVAAITKSPIVTTRLYGYRYQCRWLYSNYVDYYYGQAAANANYYCN